MILIADSGSTNSDWVLVNHKTHIPFYSKGYNPFYVDASFIQNDLTSNLPKEVNQNEVAEVHFYGAGCSSPAMNSIIEKALQVIFPQAKINVEHDLLASARALFNDESGVAAILGTGSNCAYYDGSVCHQITPSLGFLLGDEGAGSNIAKRVITKALYKQLPEVIISEILTEFNGDQSAFVKNLYEQKQVNTYVASFMKVIVKYREDEEIKEIVRASFTEFFENHVSNYKQTNQVGFVGSIAQIFKPELEGIAEKFQFSVGKTIQKPIDELVKYHLKSKV
jgi:N-acetylglucosamine kinase-like BadF-type ATPase